MFQDKLTQAQRIRLEAYAQAATTSAHNMARGAAAPSVEQLITMAQRIERYIVGEDQGDGEPLTALDLVDGPRKRP
jgi:hypothetical protein